jgi:hypothetical protein
MMDIPVTINRERLERLPVAKLAPTYRADRLSEAGCGCSGDPPGYPSYYLRNVWTQHGNHPRTGSSPTMLIFDRVVERANTPYNEDRKARLLRSLWAPLPIDHPRTRAWIHDQYRHLQHCYIDDRYPVRHTDRTLIYPVPYYKLRSFSDDPRFSEEWRRKERAAVAQANLEIEEDARRVATPENHAAVRRIRQYYPDYQPEPNLIVTPPPTVETWWERLDERPTPENCPGDPHLRQEHPVNGSWCQVCGWHDAAKEE